MKPKDLIETMLGNLDQGKPLLEGAELFRGTRGPDQAQSSFGDGMIHTSLLPQVAASYTPENRNGKPAFIGTYPIDREKSRFYADFGYEKQAEGAPTSSVKSYNVKEVEAALEPLVRARAQAASPAEKVKAEERIESMIKSSFYETPVAAKKANGDPVRPTALYAYEGERKTPFRQTVFKQMQPLSPANEKAAKAIFLEGSKSPSMRNIRKLLTLDQKNPANKAIETIYAVAQRDHQAQTKFDHGEKPLNDMLNDVSKQSLSQTQEKLEKFAKAIQGGMSSDNPMTKARAGALAETIGKMDPAKTTVNDLAKVSSDISAKFSQAQQTTAPSAKPAAAKEVAMSR